jgi:hypothetical protein
MVLRMIKSEKKRKKDAKKTDPESWQTVRFPVI